MAEALPPTPLLLALLPALVTEVEEEAVVDGEEAGGALGCGGGDSTRSHRSMVTEVNPVEERKTSWLSGIWRIVDTSVKVVGIEVVRAPPKRGVGENSRGGAIVLVGRSFCFWLF